jgi:hypothetical protein
MFVIAMQCPPADGPAASSAQRRYARSWGKVQPIANLWVHSLATWLTNYQKLGAPGLDFETWETTNPNPHSFGTDFFERSSQYY